MMIRPAFNAGFFMCDTQKLLRIFMIRVRIIKASMIWAFVFLEFTVPILESVFINYKKKNII
jgi:hypothetical protein